MAKIAIIGAGMMGSAMSIPASDNGHEVRLVGTHLDAEIINALRENDIHPKMNRKLPKGIQYFQIDRVDIALQGVDLVICGVSSFGVDWFGSQMLHRIPKSIPLLSVTKGVALQPDQTIRTFPEVFEHMAPPLLANAVGGPCTSYELADRHQTHVVFCGRELHVLDALRSMLQTPYYHISTSNDVLGVELAVALKNAYALGVSLSIGMAERFDDEPHYNTQAALFGQSVREMDKLISLFGGKPENICFGAGDLYVTIFGGRTRKLGTLLGRGLSFTEAMHELSDVTLESVATTTRITVAVQALIDRKAALASDFPLLFHINDIIANGKPVSIPWDLLIQP